MMRICLELNSEIWSRMFMDLRTEHPAAFNHRDDIRQLLDSIGISIVTETPDDPHSRWDHVEIDPEDWPLIALRWA